MTDASVWDGQVLGQLLDEDNDADMIWGDSAYRSVLIEAVLDLMRFESEINERAYRNRPLTAVQIEDNREKSQFGPESNMCLGLGLWAWAVSFCARLV